MKTLTETDNTFLRECFNKDVAILNSKVGKYAKWQNKYHPENDKFMQNVNWFISENGDSSKVVVVYSLDKQVTNPIHHQAIDNVGKFEDIVFEIWKEQFLKS